MDIEKLHKGTITFYSPEKHFGFIDSDVQEGIYFFLDTTKFIGISKEERKNIKSKFLRGDEVYFKIKKSTRDEISIEAYELTYIKNDKTLQLYDLIENQKLLKGFIKKIGTKYFVKDRQTYLFLPLKISNWETNIDEVYENRINQLVDYTIEDNSANIDKLKAVLNDIIISPIYFEILKYQETQQPISATITGQNKDGYFVTILNNSVNSFLAFEKDGTVPNTYKKWDKVQVKIRSVYDNSFRISLI